MSTDLYAHTRHIERLFVLGAGFSCSLSNEFPPTRSLLERLFDEDAALAPKWASLASFFAPFLRASEARGIPEITAVLTALEAYRAIVGKVGKADAQIREVQTRVLYAAAGLLYRASTAVATNPVLSEFCARLNPEKDAVVTLNWDIALENGLRNAGLSFQYDVLPARNDRPEQLLVLKPQGSVTWARMNPLLAAFSPVLTVAPLPPAPYWILSERQGTPPTFANPGTPTSDPAMIPPGFVGGDRAGELDWSGYMLRIVTHAAIHAKKVIVIGYSLPPDDFHVLSALSFGLPQDSWGDVVEIFVIDPSFETFQQWRNAFHAVASSSNRPVSVRHWARDLGTGLQRGGGPWA